MVDFLLSVLPQFKKRVGGKREWGMRKKRGEEYWETVVSPLPCVKVLSTFIVQEATSEESETGDARE